MDELATNGAASVPDASASIAGTQAATTPETPKLNNPSNPDDNPALNEQGVFDVPDDDELDDDIEVDFDADDDLSEEDRLKAEEERLRLEVLEAESQRLMPKDPTTKDPSKDEGFNSEQQNTPAPAPAAPQGQPMKAPKPKKTKKSKLNKKQYAPKPSGSDVKPPPAAVGAQPTNSVGGLLDSIKENEYLKDKIDISEVEARLRRTDQNLQGLDASESLRAGVLHQDFKDHIDGVEAGMTADKPFAEQLATRNAMRGSLTEVARDMHNSTPALDKFTEFSQDPYAMKVSPEQNSALFKSLEDAPLGARQHVFSEMRSEIDRNPNFGFDDAVQSAQKSLGQFDDAYRVINPDASSALNDFNTQLDSHLPKPLLNQQSSPKPAVPSPAPPKPPSGRPKVDFGDSYTNSLYEGLEREYDSLKAAYEDPDADLDRLRDSTAKFFDDSKLLSKQTDHLSQKGYGDEARQAALGKGMDGVKAFQGDIAYQALDRGFLDNPTKLDVFDAPANNVSEKLAESTKSMEAAINSIGANIGTALTNIGGMFSR